MKWSYEESVRQDRLGNKTFDIDILDEDGCVITSLELEEEFGEEELSEFRRDAQLIAVAPEMYAMLVAIHADYKDAQESLEEAGLDVSLGIGKFVKEIGELLNKVGWVQ